MRANRAGASGSRTITEEGANEAANQGGRWFVRTAFPLRAAVASFTMRVLASGVAGHTAMSQVRFRSRLLATAAAFALLLAGPIGVLAHEHSDQAESQCRICKASGVETAVLSDGPVLPVPQSKAGPDTGGVSLVPDPPATASGTPRGPPS